MQSTRAQISIAILLGTVLLILFGFVLSSGSLLQDKEPEPNLEQLNDFSIETFVDACVMKLSQESLRRLLYQGGFFTVETGVGVGLTIPFYDFSSGTVLTTDMVEEALSQFIHQSFSDCVFGLNEFEKQGYAFTASELKVTSTLGDTAQIVINFPLLYRIKQEERILQNRHYILDYNFNTIFSIASDFQAAQEKTKNMIPLSALAFIAKKHGITYKLTHHPNDVVVYSWQLSSLDPQQDNLQYNFAVQYDWDELLEDNSRINIK